jgi:hypothetical protein
MRVEAAETTILVMSLVTLRGAQHQSGTVPGAAAGLLTRGSQGSFAPSRDEAPVAPQMASPLTVAGAVTALAPDG